MNRLKALRILLVLFGLIFVAGVYPLITSVRSGWQANKEDAEPTALSLYVTMGIFLLVAARNPSANRGVTAFAAWLKYCSCRRHGSHGSSPSERTPRPADRCSCVRRHGCSPDLAGKAIGKTSLELESGDSTLLCVASHACRAGFCCSIRGKKRTLNEIRTFLSACDSAQSCRADPLSTNSESPWKLNARAGTQSVDSMSDVRT
jgi:hypothetical protein